MIGVSNLFCLVSYLLLPHGLCRPALLFFGMTFLLSGCTSPISPGPISFYKSPPDLIDREILSYSTSEEEQISDFSKPISISGLATGKVKPPSGEEFGSAIGGASKNWFFGNGLGETALNIGASIIFPPYLIYLGMKAAGNVAGYEDIGVSNALPATAKNTVDVAYSGVTSVPGVINSVIFQQEYKGVEKERKIKTEVTRIRRIYQ